MFLKKYQMFFSLCLLQAAAFGTIIEIKKMDEMQAHIKKDQLIIFDIDNTIMEPVQELGNDQWFRHRVMHYQKKGHDSMTALERALPEWVAIQNITKVKPVEEKTPLLIKDLQNKGFRVIALTTRGLGMATRTIEQLHMIGIDLAQSSPTQEEKFFMNDQGIHNQKGIQGVLFRRGILFTAGSHKGKALDKLLSLIDYKPESVLFINDKMENIKEVEYLLEEKKVSFIGLRYSYLDNKVQNFRTDVAEIQFDHFGHILSDDAAEAILENSKQRLNALKTKEKP